MPIRDGVSVTTYCEETAKHVEKLSIPGLLTRENMMTAPTDINPSWQVQRYFSCSATVIPIRRLTSYMEHSVFCQNERCCMYFCYSFKRIVPHFLKCVHLDCYECHRINVLLWEHVKKCKNSGECRIPGCRSVTRVIGWDRDMATQEPDHFRSDDNYTSGESPNDNDN